MIMDLRDHLFASAPYLMATAGAGERDEMGERNEAVLTAVGTTVADEVQRPLVGSREDDPRRADDGYDAAGPPLARGPVIDTDALWSCTTCGACVEQCPVDIEHIDHFVDMRRYQVMIESEFPTELNGLFKNLEKKGNPGDERLDAQRLDRGGRLRGPRVRHGRRGRDPRRRRVPVLGRLRRRLRGPRQAPPSPSPSCCTSPGVEFMVMGEGETCTGDPARRAGNEFVYQMQAMQNVEVLNEIKAKKIVVTCPHCLNTIGREYPQIGGDYEVVHHTQLLATLVKDGKLTPVEAVDQTVTYHDPATWAGTTRSTRPPRELVQSVPGVNFVEMERRGSKSFCCGAARAHVDGGEPGHPDQRQPPDEALDTGAEKIAVGCPFCNVMLNDGVTMRKQEGTAQESIEVLDVASLLLDSVKQ